MRLRIYNKALHEAMNYKDLQIRHNLLEYLRKDGFNSYADYLSQFHVNLVTSAEAGRPFVAAINPEKGILYINPNAYLDAASMLLRHEAGHVIFKHMEHMFAKLKDMGIDTPNELLHNIANEAGDYHICNLLYDEEDKKTAKNIRIKDEETFIGLVTELDFPEHPEYMNMDFDQLWDVFVKDYDEQELLAGEKAPSDEFIAGWNDAVEKFNAGKITIADIEAWMKETKK